MFINLSLKEIKWIRTALYHQWINMTDDDGKAVSCLQENADGTFETLCRFENLEKMLVRKEGEMES